MGTIRKPDCQRLMTYLSSGDDLRRGCARMKVKMAQDAKTRGSRDAVRTRAGLLDAARWHLTRRGYDQLGVREIASRAGVDAALVQRYFGSKKRLFEEAIAGHFDAKPLLAEQP